jgi:D-alanyl-D-alanine carboxypeptidase/D-alanyl-D-alanine carboxypeptidase (penicillin-binding protein 5/6)
VNASGYVLINADTFEVLAGDNIHKKLSMASTTKIMTALILVEQNTPEKEVITTKEMVTVEGSSMGLLPGDSVSYYELIVGMMLPSGNDAANTAAISVAGSIQKFTELMNNKAKDIGMENTHFVTPSGLDDDEHYSTAFDMALLAAYALKNDVLRDIMSKPSITVTYGNPPYQRTLSNHNKLLKTYEYCIGVKTGFTKKSGRCLVSAAEKDGCRVIAVTLNAPSDWNDHKYLLEYGLSCLSQYDVTYNLPINSVSVVGGNLDSVTVATERFMCGCTDISKNGISAEYEFLPFIYAPVKIGQTVGKVNYYYDNKIINSIDIITINSTDKKEIKFTFKQKFKKNLYNIFKHYI